MSGTLDVAANAWSTGGPAVAGGFFFIVTTAFVFPVAFPSPSTALSSLRGGDEPVELSLACLFAGFEDEASAEVDASGTASGAVRLVPAGKGVETGGDLSLGGL